MALRAVFRIEAGLSSPRGETTGRDEEQSTAVAVVLGVTGLTRQSVTRLWSV